MIDITALLILIAKQVRKQIGEKSLNELIAMGIAVYEQVKAIQPSTRSLGIPEADPSIVVSVLEELSSLEE